MSAPQTNLEKQTRRHWAPLLGIALAALFGVGIIVYWLGEEVSDADPQPPAGLDAGTVNEPATSTIPAEVVEPDAQSGTTNSPASEPTTRESPPDPNAPEGQPTE
ncbi:hypothetical protein [Paracoccus sp. IB05]|uniref:hypothetical protein n=1 Tax=Paracoccus sp. IB05 TaxID=2779367 RepID=UPI0018E7ABA6|nr:hypothetical protein [Paracoccus sp. IB05]MBJ2149802.1 hypothetical protein [Paracoccus sp. IB05]